MPLFALANAGIPLSTEQIGDAMGSPVTLGVVVGLVLGKMLGIVGGAELAVRLRLGRLAPGLTRLHLLGGATLAGMGFTISLFIVDLAFSDADTANAARIGILMASVLAAVLGTVLLRYAAHRYPAEEMPDRLEPPVDVRFDHVRGTLDAPVTLVEYGDYESAQSHGAHAAVREVQRRLPNQVRFMFRHLPDTETDPAAQMAAEAAEAAGVQERFWEMHDQLFDTSSDVTPMHLTIDDLFAKATVIGLDQASFTRDLGE
ncbi:MAG: Na+/H+ antiporter NhaA [Rhodococcus sp. (in: high G+C Gram-positive bacteria)]|uniref:Na+/H+ antiporter NhaA n=1 Tax=Rhodococcus sp. TaxID=1831 RepID=UPI003BB740DE